MAGVPKASDGSIRVARVTEATLLLYREAVIEGVVHPDDTGVLLDHFTRQTIG